MGARTIVKTVKLLFFETIPALIIANPTLYPEGKEVAGIGSNKLSVSDVNSERRT
jgi:hypothetical protein